MVIREDSEGLAYWTPRDCKDTDKQIGAGYNCFGYHRMTDQDPRDGRKRSILGVIRLAVLRFQSRHREHDDHHAEGADEKRGSTTPFVEEENGR